MRLFDMDKDQIITVATQIDTTVGINLIHTYKKAGNRERFIAEGVSFMVAQGESQDEALRFATASADAAEWLILELDTDITKVA